MASPRIFVSSTCYDLQEVRFQLRKFIEDFGFEPVMSEYGDIFYDYQKHIQDSCTEEINRCQLFILIIGNHYGSIYHQHKEIQKYPESVTLREFKKAIETKIFKHIFVNKFVDYDYKNYEKSKSKFIKEQIDKKKLTEETDEDEVNKIIESFNNNYPFPQESYRYIFRFLSIVYSLKSNNAVLTFENFDDIKSAIKKQWAGFMYESLTKNDTVPFNLVESIKDKIEKIDRQLKLLVEGKENSKDSDNVVKIDLSKMLMEQNIESFENLKTEINNLILNILYEDNPFEPRQRIILKQKAEMKNIQSWLESLEEIVKTNKWSKYIEVPELFKKLSVNYRFYTSVKDVDYETILKFFKVYKGFSENISDEDFNSFLVFLTNEFNKYYEPDPEPTPSDDDLPF